MSSPAKPAAAARQQQKFGEKTTLATPSDTAKSVRSDRDANDSTSPDARYSQGQRLFKAGKWNDAKLAMADVISADPRHADAYFVLGMALANEHAFPDAVAAFENYLNIAPEGPNAAQAKYLIQQLK
jgi:TolA-binding protein